jgi:hypothetical protein
MEASIQTGILRRPVAAWDLKRQQPPAGRLQLVGASRNALLKLGDADYSGVPDLLVGVREVSQSCV